MAAARRALERMSMIPGAMVKKIFGQTPTNYHDAEERMKNIALIHLNPFWRFVYFKFSTNAQVDSDFLVLWEDKVPQRLDYDEAQDPVKEVHRIQWWEVVIHPISSFRMYWDLLITLLILYTIIVVPFRVAYYFRGSSLRHGDFDSWDTAVDFIFLFDILLNFNTGYIVLKDQLVIMNRRRILIDYSRTYFLIDLASSLPYDLMAGDSANSSYRIPRMLRVLRILKLIRLIRIYLAIKGERLQDLPLLRNFKMAYRDFIFLGSLLFLWVHWSACIQFLAAAVADFPASSWVDRGGLVNAPVWEQHVWAVFKSLSQMVTIGYGRHEPAVTYEAMVVIMSIIVGAGLWMNFQGLVVNLLLTSGSADAKYQLHRDLLDDYMRKKKVPMDLRARVRDNIEYKWRTKKIVDERQILAILPEATRAEIALWNAAPLLNAVPYFSNMDDPTKATLASKLSSEIYVPGDVIIHQGQYVDSMLFISRGSVQVEVDDVAVSVIHQGSYFGEVGILMSRPSEATFRALTHIELYKLDKNDLEETLEGHPGAAGTLAKIAMRRLEWLKEQKRRMLEAATEIVKENSHHGAANPVADAALQRVRTALSYEEVARVSDNGPLTPLNGNGTGDGNGSAHGYGSAFVNAFTGAASTPGGRKGSLQRNEPSANGSEHVRGPSSLQAGISYHLLPVAPPLPASAPSRRSLARTSGEARRAEAVALADSLLLRLDEILKLHEGPEAEEALLKLRIQLEALGEMHRAIQAENTIAAGIAAFNNPTPTPEGTKPPSVAPVAPPPVEMHRPTAVAAQAVGELVQREYQETHDLLLRGANITGDLLQKVMSSKRISNTDLGIGGVVTAPGVMPKVSSFKKIPSINRIARGSYIGAGESFSNQELQQQSESERAAIYRRSYAGAQGSATALQEGALGPPPPSRGFFHRVSSGAGTTSASPGPGSRAVGGEAPPPAADDGGRHPRLAQDVVVPPTIREESMRDVQRQMRDPNSNLTVVSSSAGGEGDRSGSGSGRLSARLGEGSVAVAESESESEAQSGAAREGRDGKQQRPLDLELGRLSG